MIERLEQQDTELNLDLDTTIVKEGNEFFNKIWSKVENEYIQESDLYEETYTMDKFLKDNLGYNPEKWKFNFSDIYYYEDNYFKIWEPYVRTKLELNTDNKEYQEYYESVDKNTKWELYTTDDPDNIKEKLKKTDNEETNKKNYGKVDTRLLDNKIKLIALEWDKQEEFTWTAQELFTKVNNKEQRKVDPQNNPLRMIARKVKYKEKVKIKEEKDIDNYSYSKWTTIIPTYYNPYLLINWSNIKRYEWKKYDVNWNVVDESWPHYDIKKEIKLGII